MTPNDMPARSGLTPPRPANPHDDTGWLAHLSKTELADLIGYPGEDTAEQRRIQRALFGPTGRPVTR